MCLWGANERNGRTFDVQAIQECLDVLDLGVNLS